ncbi:MAG: sigma-70 family RNA polymerase sigma factor [Myxococcaceae bacterium]|nr:sigma-70 family RNA polymerase sigma factor [Myxococcaceae bacterium]
MEASSSLKSAPAAPHPVPVPADFSELYETYFDFVWANARRLGVAPAQVDDAVQDVFLAVYRRLPEFRGEASFKTWLFHFVLRVASTYRRSANAAERRSAPDATAEAADPTTPDAQVATKQAAELMYRLLEELPENRRALFILVELEEVSVAEAAAVLELNLNTAHSRLRDARRDFERAVERERAREDWRAR